MKNVKYVVRYLSEKMTKFSASCAGSVQAGIMILIALVHLILDKPR